MKALKVTMASIIPSPVIVETNQEHGQYGKQAGVIECGEKPAEITLPATTNFEPVLIQFGPRPKLA